MAFWRAASISATEAGSRELVAVPEPPAFGRALMAGKPLPCVSAPVGADGEGAAGALGEARRPPMIIPAPNPASVSSATEDEAICSHASVFRKSINGVEPTAFPAMAKEKGLLGELYAATLAFAGRPYKPYPLLA